MSPILQVENLTKSFGDLVLFENISFCLKIYPSAWPKANVSD